MKRKSRKVLWPQLPRQIFGINGPIDVEISRETLERGRLGTAENGTRRIRLEASLKPEVAYHTLFHEVVEMALMDTGLHNAMQGKRLQGIKEAVCDAVASGLLAQFRHDHRLE